MDRREFLTLGVASASSLLAGRRSAGAGEWLDSVSAAARGFHESHAICDMLGLNLNHPRILVDNVNLGQHHEGTYRGDFVKFKDWGMTLVMCKGGTAFYSEDYGALWRKQPGEHPANPEPLHLTLAHKNPTQLLLANLDRFLGHVETNSERVVLVRRFADLDRARAQGKVALLMGANRSDWFGDSPGVIRMLGRLGLRMITLGQATRELGYDPYNEARSGGRLTEFGVRTIEEMNRAGILVDVSHLNDVCTLDAVEVSKRPVVASHSNPRRLEGTLRDVPDTVMKALAGKGGVLGLMPPISRPAGDLPLARVSAQEIEKSLEMIRYAVGIMGVDSIGIGTHFCTAAMPWITDALLRARFSEQDTAKIMGGNYLRVLRSALPA
jgi:membrane dipeptidase